MKWVLCWLLLISAIGVFLGGKTVRHLTNDEGTGILLLSGVVVIVLRLLWVSESTAELRFRISSLLLSLPNIGKFAFKTGLRNFRPGSEPDGFRGIKWGTAISTLGKDMQRQQLLGDSEIYTRAGDVLKLGRTKLEKVEYVFFEGTFSVVFIDTEGFENWKSLKEVVFATFGKGFQWDRGAELYSWKGKIAGATLKYDETFGKGYFTMQSNKYVKHFFVRSENQLREEARGDF
jgi:hypothetical protein